MPTSCATISPRATGCRTIRSLGKRATGWMPSRPSSERVSDRMALGCALSGKAGDGHLLHNLHAESLQRRHMGRRVAHQPDAMNPEIGQNLPSEAHLAQGPLPPVLMALALSGLAMEEDAPRAFGAFNRESAAGVVQINERAASRLGNS